MQFPVTEKKQQALIEAMKRLGIDEADLEETFARSGGPGGQHVNKTSTCVVLRHRPTGIQVRCAKERSQAMNRFWARRMLVEKLDKKIKGKQSAEAKRVAKIRRQKRKRSKRAKDKMLDAKTMQGLKKALRRKPETGQE